MLIRTRLQKSQYPNIVRWIGVGQAISFNRDIALMFGYTSFQALLVGGGGGSSGATNVSPYRYQSGGGGGSSKLVSGLLTSLSPITTGVVGSGGTNFFASQNPSGAGGRGGNTTFGPWTAYGGYGGKSAHTSSVANHGGEGANPDGSPGPAGGAEGASYPVAGSWNATTGEGSGGGGGAGAGQLDTFQVGAAGAGAAYLAPGQTSAGYDSLHGGGGGGCCLAPLTGIADEYYGCGMFNTGNHTTNSGALVIKLS